MMNVRCAVCNVDVKLAAQVDDVQQYRRPRTPHHAKVFHVQWMAPPTLRRVVAAVECRGDVRNKSNEKRVWRRWQ
jgi:hypothetical protein